jgi:hypothetical protein
VLHTYYFLKPPCTALLEHCAAVISCGIITILLYRTVKWVSWTVTPWGELVCYVSAPLFCSQAHSWREPRCILHCGVLLLKSVSSRRVTDECVPLLSIMVTCPSDWRCWHCKQSRNRLLQQPHQRATGYWHRTNGNFFSAVTYQNPVLIKCFKTIWMLCI